MNVVVSTPNSNTEYKIVLTLEQINLSWEKLIEYDALRKIKKHLKAQYPPIRMESPFPNEKVWKSITAEDLVLVKAVSSSQGSLIYHEYYILVVD